MAEQRQKLLDNYMAQQVLHLTVGSQVMLIKNIDETLVNGSMGIVVAFDEPVVYDRNFGGESQVETSKVGVVKALALDESRRKRPVVDFNVPGGGIRQVMLEPETWKVELPNGEAQASRTAGTGSSFNASDCPPYIHTDAAVSSHPSMGDVYTQVTRSDT